MIENQGELFGVVNPHLDAEAAKAERDIALKQVKRNEGQEFRDEFRAAHARALARLGRITSEDVLSEMTPGTPEPHHPSAVGALMRSASSQAGLRKVDRVASKKPGSHASEIAVWGR